MDSDLREKEGVSKELVLLDIIVKEHKRKRLEKKFNERKAPGPDGISK